MFPLQNLQGFTVLVPKNAQLFQILDIICLKMKYVTKVKVNLVNCDSITVLFIPSFFFLTFYVIVCKVDDSVCNEVCGVDGADVYTVYSH